MSRHLKSDGVFNRVGSSGLTDPCANGATRKCLLLKPILFGHISRCPAVVGAVWRHRGGDHMGY